MNCTLTLSLNLTPHTQHNQFSCRNVFPQHVRCCVSSPHLMEGTCMTRLFRRVFFDRPVRVSATDVARGVVVAFKGTTEVAPSRRRCYIALAIHKCFEAAQCLAGSTCIVREEMMVQRRAICVAVHKCLLRWRGSTRLTFNRRARNKVVLYRARNHTKASKFARTSLLNFHKVTFLRIVASAFLTLQSGRLSPSACDERRSRRLSRSCV